MTSQQWTDVVVALIEGDASKDTNPQQDPVWSSHKSYFIAERTSGEAIGLLEFPGGKVEIGETQFQALQRELQEEIGIQVIKAEPLFHLATQAPDQIKSNLKHPSLKHSNLNKAVRLFIWRVTEYKGTPYGAEAQPTAWRRLNWCDRSLFLGPNSHIFTALRLPALQAIASIDKHTSIQAMQQWLEQLKRRFGADISVRFRNKGLNTSSYLEQTLPLVKWCRTNHIYSVVDALQQDQEDQEDQKDQQDGPNYLKGLIQAIDAGAQAIHFQSWWLKKENYTACGRLFKALKQGFPGVLLSSSCHDLNEIQCFDQFGVDFLVISQVLETASHSENEGLGWDKWQNLSYSCMQPNYALGGLTLNHLPQIKEKGGYGLSGISAFASHALANEAAASGR